MFHVSLPPLPLPAGIRSRTIDGINGLAMHVLEAGFETPGRKTVILLHGFPELAFSWRKVMPALADAGYHVLAPDQRGYGRTVELGRATPDVAYDDDLAPYRMLNLVRDTVGLVRAYGLDTVHAVVGHDFGASVAVWSAITRPDVFTSLVFMSAPQGGVPAVPAGIADRGWQPVVDPIHGDLARLARPRKHYQWYYSTRAAAEEMTDPPQGLHAFLRAYYHHKSADWAANTPVPLAAWSAGELARMPTYYIMDLAETMPETVSHEMPSAAEIAANTWLTEAELAVYASEYGRTGFQASLNWYRCRTTGKYNGELEVFDRRTIDVPSMFVAGSSDWGIHQKPGEFERMQAGFLADMRGCHLIDGAGHWVQQERADATNKVLVEFLGSV